MGVDDTGEFVLGQEHTLLVDFHKSSAITRLQQAGLMARGLLDRVVGKITAREKTMRIGAATSFELQLNRGEGQDIESTTISVQMGSNSPRRTEQIATAIPEQIELFWRVSRQLSNGNTTRYVSFHSNLDLDSHYVDGSETTEQIVKPKGIFKKPEKIQVSRSVHVNYMSHNKYGAYSFRASTSTPSGEKVGRFDLNSKTGRFEPQETPIPGESMDLAEAESMCREFIGDNWRNFDRRRLVGAYVDALSHPPALANVKF